MPASRQRKLSEALQTRFLGKVPVCTLAYNKLGVLKALQTE